MSHCGLGILNHSSLGPWPQNGADFNAVVNWVEKGVAPTQVIGSGNTAAPAFIPGSPTALTRPLCPYPQTAVYNGSGAVTDAASWHCGGDLEKNVPVGAPAFGAPRPASGVLRRACQIQARGQRTARLSEQRRRPVDVHGTTPTLVKDQQRRPSYDRCLSKEKTTAGVCSDAHGCFAPSGSRFFCVEDLDKQPSRVTSIKELPWAPDCANYAYANQERFATAPAKRGDRLS